MQIFGTEQQFVTYTFVPRYGQHNGLTATFRVLRHRREGNTIIWYLHLGTN